VLEKCFSKQIAAWLLPGVLAAESDRRGFLKQYILKVKDGKGETTIRGIIIL
jgi:hypothetical protein